MENFEEKINELNLKIEKMENFIRQKLNFSKEFETENLNELFTALAKAQEEMEIAKLDSTNPFFKTKYADLASVVKASRPYLSKNGICIIQRIAPNGNGARYLFTRLCHSSGQWMESKMQIDPPKNDIQSLGSYITYLRRYTYASIVGVVTSEEDDDGEGGMKEDRKKEVQQNNKITKAQLEVLANELEERETILESLLNGFKINKLADLPAKHYASCLERIKQIKETE